MTINSGRFTNMSIDLTGQKFNRLLAVRIQIKTHTYNGRECKKAYWECLCDCGKTVLVRSDSLKKGTTKSCGCFNSDRVTTHGRTRDVNGRRTPEFRAWQMLKQRCYNRGSCSYQNYGGRGIAVCSRWLESFENFFADMGLRPSSKHSIERKDNNGPYAPGNCYWATDREQMNNRRNTPMLTLNGVTKSLSYWADELNLSIPLIWNRLRRGWSHADALGPIRGRQ